MAWTVETLRAILADKPDDMLVVLAKDAEGNGYSPLASWNKRYYTAATTWYGWTASNKKEAGKHAVKAIVLWPTN